MHSEGEGVVPPCTLSSQLSTISSVSTPIGIDSLEGSTGPLLRLRKALPYELQEHCTIYFEEGLCTKQGLFLMV